MGVSSVTPSLRMENSGSNKIPLSWLKLKPRTVGKLGKLDPLAGTPKPYQKLLRELPGFEPGTDVQIIKSQQCTRYKNPDQI